jgi:hypothetical protein
MSSLYKARVGAYLHRAGDKRHPAQTRGRYYENLLTYLLESIPGCQVQRNTQSFYGTEEVDITVANEKASGGLRMLPEMFLVECKNWSQPVDSTTLGYFVNVVADRGCSLGILAAANGITGHQQHRSRAHAIGAAALIRKIRILLVNDEDLKALQQPRDLVALLHHRNLLLTAHGTIHLG